MNIGVLNDYEDLSHFEIKHALSILFETIKRGNMFALFVR